MYILLTWYGPFLAASEATTASKQPWRSNWTSDLKSVTQITYVNIVYMVWALLAASEATSTASKQPRRSKLKLQVNLVTLIYYKAKFQDIFVSQNLQLSDGDDNHDPLTCVASPQVINIW